MSTSAAPPVRCADRTRQAVTSSEGRLTYFARTDPFGLSCPHGWIAWCAEETCPGPPQAVLADPDAGFARTPESQA